MSAKISAFKHITTYSQGSLCEDCKNMTNERKWESQSHHERKPERNSTLRGGAVKLGDTCLSQFWFLSPAVGFLGRMAVLFPGF